MHARPRQSGMQKELAGLGEQSVTGGHRKDTHMTTQQTIEQIARKHLHIETLETRKSDRLDFHNVAVWSIEAALKAAFKAGQKAEKNGGAA
jgi:sulfate adenylyltransferase subunit 1 (EFTu-like GTPase family)